MDDAEYTTRPVSDAQPESDRLQHFPNQSVDDSRLRVVHLTTALLDVVQRTIQPAVLDRRDWTALDAAASDCTGGHAIGYLALGQVGYRNTDRWCEFNAKCTKNRSRHSRSPVNQYPYIHAILVAITSRNAGSVRTRTVASALYNISVQASNIFSTQVYRTKDAPMYRQGNKALIVVSAFTIVLLIAIKLFYVKVNA